MKSTIHLNHFTGANAMERFAQAMAWLRSNPASTLIVEPGVYELSTPLAKQTMADVFSGAYGENPQDVMFSPHFSYSSGLSMAGQRGTTISAYGVTLVIDGFMEPITLCECSGVTIEGLSIDYKRKPFSMGIVSGTQWTDLSKGCGSFDVVFGSEYPLQPHTPMPRFNLYDPSAERFVGYGEYRITRRERLENQHWRFWFEGLIQNPDGMECYVWHTFHSRPAIRIENAADIRLQDVTIHAQPGMGVVAHRSSNILLNGIRVIPPAGVHMSTNTDATHFTSCKGTVRIENSIFEGQGDDAVNIHTYYHTIKETDGCTCLLQLEAPDGTHTQTPDFPDTGDLLEWTDLRSLACMDLYRVLAVEQIDPWTCHLEVDKPLPEIHEGFAFANASQMARFEFVGNLCRNHIARSVLVKVKEALIENNTILDASGTGIYVAAESEWFEGLCTTKNIVIQRNHIINCARANGSGRKNGAGGICVTVDADDPTANTHACVIIRDNIIDCPEAPHGIYVSNTQKAVLERNSISSLMEPVIQK